MYNEKQGKQKKELLPTVKENYYSKWGFHNGILTFHLWLPWPQVIRLHPIINNNSDQLLIFDNSFWKAVSFALLVSIIIWNITFQIILRCVLHKIIFACFRCWNKRAVHDEIGKWLSHGFSLHVFITLMILILYNQLTMHISSAHLFSAKI